MKKYLYAILISLWVLSCGPFSLSMPKPLNSKTHYFDVNKNAEVTVVTEVLVNADTLKSLLVVPNGDYFLEMGKNLGYFNEVMTYLQFENKILELGDTLDLRLESPDKLKLNKAATLYKPFVIMKEPKHYQDENYAFATGLIIYDPLRGETIFQNKILTKNALYIYKNKILLPLYNSFLNYLRQQNKNH